MSYWAQESNDIFHKRRDDQIHHGVDEERWNRNGKKSKSCLHEVSNLISNWAFQSFFGPLSHLRSYIGR